MDPKNPEPGPAAEKPTISVKLRVDIPTDTVIYDKEKGFNLLLLAVPLNMPKHLVLGLVWNVLMNLTNMFAAAEAKAASGKPGIIRAGLSDAMTLGKKLMPGA